MVGWIFSCWERFCELRIFGGTLAFGVLLHCFIPSLKFGTGVVPFITNSGMLIWFCVFMISGNIAFPLLLRLWLEIMDLLGLEKRWRLPIRLIKEHPRQYFNFLFPIRYVSCIFTVHVTELTFVDSCCF
jgi:Trk-type K+ transport system membrane component